jgi:hypothetical protein
MMKRARNGIVSIPRRFWSTSKYNKRIILYKLYFEDKGVIRSMNDISHANWEDLDLWRKLMLSVVK